MTGIDLRALRLNRGLSVRAAADEMGVNKTVLLRAERGSSPQPRHALKIAGFYGLAVTDVWPVENREAA